MFKFKSITPKTPIRVGAYFRYTGPAASGITVYKLVGINYTAKKITFAWWDIDKGIVEFSKDWCTIDEFKDHMQKGLYKVISESEVDSEALKNFYVQT